MNYLLRHRQYKAKYPINNQGFTLIELIITMVIAAVVLAIAVPSMQSIIEKNRIANEADRLFTLLKQARNNAIVTGTPTMLCRNDEVDLDDLSCDNNIDGEASDWSGDILLYSALAGVDVRVPSATGRFGALRIQQIDNNEDVKNQMLQTLSLAPDNGVKIYIGNEDRAIRFDADGSVLNIALDGQDLRFAVCDPRIAVPEQNGRIIVVNEVGVIRTFNTDPNDPSRDCMIP